MYNKSRGGKSGGFKSKGGSGEHRSWNHGSEGGRPMMHGAICNSCKSPCEVPFRPNGKKPIFCNNCFKRDGESAPRNSNRSERGPRSFSSAPAGGHDNIGAQLREINEKLDALIEALSGEEEEGG